MTGLLVNPDCDGSMDALHDAASDCEAYAGETDADRIREALFWSQRDLDRLQHDRTWGSRW